MEILAIKLFCTVLVIMGMAVVGDMCTDEWSTLNLVFEIIESVTGIIIFISTVVGALWIIWSL